MDGLYKKLEEKGIERKQKSSKHMSDDEDLAGRKSRNDENYEEEKRSRSRISNTKSKQNFNNKSLTINNTNFSITDILSEAFEDTRYKGKQFNSGRFSAKEKKDILANTEYGKKLKKKLEKQHIEEKKAQEKEIILKKLKENELKVLPKFKCGNYKDSHAHLYKSVDLKKMDRAKSANDMYNSSRLSLIDKKEPLKPFICGKIKPMEKIKYFSPLSISARDLKNSLISNGSKLNLTNLQLLNALDLANKKPISDKPLKFGQYKDELAKSLFTDRSIDKKSIKSIKESKEFQEFLKKEQKLKETPKAAFKVGKVLPPKPPAYFSPVQRKTLSEIHKEISRSGRSSANTSLMNQSRK